MKHKWYKEIQAWSEGAEIQFFSAGEWIDIDVDSEWESDEFNFRIKPQPKEPQYLYVINNWGSLRLSQDKELLLNEFYVGKIEVQND